MRDFRYTARAKDVAVPIKDTKKGIENVHLYYLTRILYSL